MFRHAVVTEVAPAPLGGECFSGKVWREALEPDGPLLWVSGQYQAAEMTGLDLSTSVNV